MAQDARAAASVLSAHDVSEADAWSASVDCAPMACVDVPVLMGDERRMKRELVAWAKAVVSMVVRESMHC
jgi:hypothetical protein